MKVVLAVITSFWVTNVFSFELSSSAFEHEKYIPREYTCDGKNISPPLYWKDPPDGTKSFVLIMDDPDSSTDTWDHWILYNIPETATILLENIQTLSGAVTGRNSWNETAYKGPCSPPGTEHRYFFKLYALDISLPTIAGMTKKDVESAMMGHVITSTELIGKYQRPKIGGAP